MNDIDKFESKKSNEKHKSSKINDENLKKTPKENLSAGEYDFDN